MGLFDASAINNQTVAAGGFTRNTIPTALTSATSSVQSAISTVETNIASFVSGAVSGAEQLFSSVASPVVEGISGILSDIFGNTNSPGSANVNVSKSDPLATLFGSNTPPQSNIFTTSPINTGLSPFSLGGSSGTNYSLSTGLTSELSTLSTRFGIPLTTLPGLNQASNSTVSSSLVAGLYQDVSAVGTTYGQVTTAVNSFGFTNPDFTTAASSLSKALTGSDTSFNSYYNPSYPFTTSTSGSTPVSGVPAYIPTSTVNSISSSMSSLGCDTSAWSNSVQPYNTNQSLYSALMAFVSQLGMTSALSSLLGCSRFDSNGQSFATNLFYQYAGSNASVANTLLQAIPTSSVSVTPSLLRSIVTNPNLQASDTGSILAMFSKLGVQGSSALGSGTTINGAPVWNSRTISSTPAYLTTALSGNPNLFATANGVTVNLGF